MQGEKNWNHCATWWRSLIQEGMNGSFRGCYLTRLSVERVDGPLLLWRLARCCGGGPAVIDPRRAAASLSAPVSLWTLRNRHFNKPWISKDMEKNPSAGKCWSRAIFVKHSTPFVVWKYCQCSSLTLLPKIVYLKDGLLASFSEFRFLLCSSSHLWHVIV